VSEAVFAEGVRNLLIGFLLRSLNDLRWPSRRERASAWLRELGRWMPGHARLLDALIAERVAHPRTPHGHRPRRARALTPA